MPKMKRPLIVILSVVLILVLQYIVVSDSLNRPPFGSLDSPLGLKHEVPPGGISVLDFEKQLKKNMLIEELQVFANADTSVRLKVWHLNGDAYEAVAESKIFELSKGTHTFFVGSILAKKGDFLGLYMNPFEVDRSGTHSSAGRVFAVGDMDSIPKDTGYRDGQTGYTFLVKGVEEPSNSKLENLLFGSIESPLGMKNEVPPGGLSVLDFEKPIDADISINEVKILSNADSNEIRLKIWRLNGKVYQAVSESKMLVITKGLNKIHVDNISAKKGDFLGLYMKTSEIDRSRKHMTMGRVYALGDAKEIQKDTPAHDGQTGYTFTVLGIGNKHD